MGERLQHALDLMRRLPPAAVTENLHKLITAAPDLSEDLLCSVDQPLKIMNDPVSGREFLICDYNRDGDSYRSPWSNKYFPDASGGEPYPSTQLRELEKAANDAFDTYRDMYYEGGLSSVYLWDLEGSSFAGCLLFKKKNDMKGSRGVWDSIHVIQVTPSGSKALYVLTSTVLLTLTTENAQIGQFNLGGNLTRRVEREMDVNDANTHLMNIGRLVEETENKMRGSIHDIYFSKTQEVTNYVHKTSAASATAQLMDMQRQLHQRIASR